MPRVSVSLSGRLSVTKPYSPALHIGISSLALVSISDQLKRIRDKNDTTHSCWSDTMVTITKRAGFSAPFWGNGDWV